MGSQASASDSSQHGGDAECFCHGRSSGSTFVKSQACMSTESQFVPDLQTRLENTLSLEISPEIRTRKMNQSFSQFLRAVPAPMVASLRLLTSVKRRRKLR